MPEPAGSVRVPKQVSEEPVRSAGPNAGSRSDTPVSDDAPADSEHPTGQAPGPDGGAGAPPRNRLKARLIGKAPFLDQLREDRHANEGHSRPGFQAVATARFGAWLDEGKFPAKATPALRRVHAAAEYVVRTVYGIEVPHTVTLGRRVRIAHQSGIVVHPNAVIGDDVIIRQNVTLGAGSGDPATFAKQAPRIGAGVSLGAGCAIVGRVTIGDGAVIGPNAVVMTNIPAGATVLAQPPRVVRKPAPSAD
ncbi:MAG: hypothetical protein CSA58_02020 [Micrococcales bacterium]|nr:MAG: hypothetical protein CSB46_01630 [Micrococcales bacterium]PIE27865.1 MAG: hypothetical protein CSA58_02020 [Micrococcales bacterium]